MPEAAGANADPSMEEILASIRRIISDETPAAEAAPAPAPAPAVNGTHTPAPQEDVLELTQMIQDDGSVKNLKTPEPEMPPPPPEVKAAPMPPPLPMMKGEGLISEPAAHNAASALSSLAATVEIERLSANAAAATFVGNSGRTLEDMVIELMRPMLKEWLDKNLPSTVERLVQKEIERITKKS